MRIDVERDSAVAASRSADIHTGSEAAGGHVNLVVHRSVRLNGVELRHAPPASFL